MLGFYPEPFQFTGPTTRSRHVYPKALAFLAYLSTTHSPVSTSCLVTLPVILQKYRGQYFTQGLYPSSEDNKHS